MKSHPAIPCVFAVISGLLAPTGARASDAVDGVTAVSARVSSDYVRTRLPDGSFQPELYAFGKGGYWGGQLSDSTIDKLQFSDVAKVIAAPLASQQYFPAKNPITAKLLIMVYWGTTAVPGPSSSSFAYDKLSAAQANLSAYMVSSGNPLQRTVIAGPAADAAMAQMSEAMTLVDMENHQRDSLDLTNARMLGYDSEGLIGTDYGNNIRGTAFAARRTELIEEIEENRYFVVLMAYDFQLLWKEKKHKLVWETRFSISERRNAFDKALPVMAQYASQYFGQDSKGLLRTRVPEGQVKVGEPRSLGEVDAPRK
jgi:hypothetical protein